MHIISIYVYIYIYIYTYIHIYTMYNTEVHFPYLAIWCILKEVESNLLEEKELLQFKDKSTLLKVGKR